jgi:hypothetical protein
MFVQHPDKWFNFLLLLSMLAVLVAISLLIQRWRWHRQFAKTPMFHDSVTANIDNQSLRLKGQTFESSQYWGQFSDVYESSRVFVFGTADNRFVFLPKSGMNPSQIAEMRTLINANAKGKVKLSVALA